MTRILSAILRHAAERPGAIAIETAREKVSWEALAAGLPPAVALVKSRVGTASLAYRLDHGLASCLLDLALIESAAVAIPLAPFFTPDQIKASMMAGGCRAEAVGAAVTLSPDGMPVLDFVIEPNDGPEVILPAATCKVSFTSGSTGQPKGICLSADHSLDVASAVVGYLGVAHAGRHLPILPPGILLENVAGFYASLLAGGTYVALPQVAVGLANPFRPDFAMMLESIDSHAITSLILVPEYLAGLVGAMEASRRRLPLLTLVAVGGARITPTLLERAADLGLPVRQGYGLTECASVVALERGAESSRGSVGRTIGVNRIELAEDGEIIIHGPGFLGTTAAAREQGPIYSGDIGRVDDAGNLWIEGRKSNLIITSFGRNISPEWVEGVLVDQPAILQAMVRGDGHAAIDALIVPANAEADICAAVGAANALLPEYAQVAEWQIVPPFLPMNGQLTGNGRLRRAAIDAAYPERSPDMPFFDRLVAETREAQARFAMIPQLQAGLTGRISRADYIAYLTQAFHHVRHTVPLMEAARERLSHNRALVSALDEYIEEETGHEAWILEDIDAAGGDARQVAISSPDPATARMVQHAYSTIRVGNPAAFFGMVYVLEGTSIAMASVGADAVRQTLGLPPEAFHYLNSHGALDQDHMQFFERLMNRIDDPDDQQAIIAMARDMFGLFGGVFSSIELTADEHAAV